MSRSFVPRVRPHPDTIINSGRNGCDLGRLQTLIDEVVSARKILDNVRRFHETIAIRDAPPTPHISPHEHTQRASHHAAVADRLFDQILYDTTEHLIRFPPS